jgi:hypothetical protein
MFLLPSRCSDGYLLDPNAEDFPAELPFLPQSLLN